MRNSKSKILSNNKSYSSSQKDFNCSKASSIMKTSYKKFSEKFPLPNISNSFKGNKSKSKIYFFKTNKNTRINLNSGIDKKHNLYMERNTTPGL